RARETSGEELGSGCGRSAALKCGFRSRREAVVFVSADPASHEENSSEVLSEPEVADPEPASSVIKENGVQKDAEHECTAVKIGRKQPSKEFTCPTCGKAFALKCLMNRHCLTHSKPHLCSECGKRFAGLRGLIAHSRKHTGEKLYKCSKCGTEFAYKSTFHRHMRQHNLNKPITHTCSLCEEQFTGKQAFQRHICCALKKTFVCSLCPETFECRQSLDDHENLHSGNRDFVCEMCGMTFFSSENCEVLSLGFSDTSKNTREKLFTCEVCGKGCSHRSALKHHMLTHTGERPYVCETCGKRCGHASALQNHMRIHTGKKPGEKPVCNVCGKKFRCMVNLKYHTSVHTGERPYACDQCDKRFSNPSNLKMHMMTHSEEKMHSCSICGRKFTQLYSLKLHRQVHAGERPYHCAVCGKTFITNSVFRTHQKVHLQEAGQGPCFLFCVLVNCVLFYLEGSYSSQLCSPSVSHSLVPRVFKPCVSLCYWLVCLRVYSCISVECFSMFHVSGFYISGFSLQVFVPFIIIL
uniref:C2H2-type domain-containing protein n=1 Tax=Neolamprologus brichardi TaxID=32507 RepID=A0A3Q4ICS2_NEOBR